MGAVSAPARLAVPGPDLATVVALVAMVGTTVTTTVALLLFVRTEHAVLTTPEAGAPSAVVLLVASVIVISAGAVLPYRQQQPQLPVGLAVATVAGVLPLWSSWSALEPAVRATLLPLSVLVIPALTSAVARRRTGLLVASWTLALLALAVHLLTYDPLHDLTCLRVCDRVVAPLEPLLGGGVTGRGLAVSLALSALASAAAFIALLTTARRREWALPVAAACVGSVVADLSHLVALASTSGLPPHLHARTWPPPAVAVVGLVLAVGLTRTLHRRRRVDRLLRQLEGHRTTPGKPTTDVAVAFAVPGEPGRYVDVRGEEVPAPLVGNRSRGGPVLVDHSLVHDLTPARRLALQNTRLAALARARLRDVRAAQRRAVRRSDEEQHRIERDLHDGVQQTLVGAAFLIATAEQRSDPRTAEELARSRERLTGALDRLRALSHGVVPVVLDDEGVAAALEELALESPVPLSLDCDGAVEVPNEIGRPLYLVVARVLQLDAARAARVRLAHEGSEIALDVQLAGAGPQPLDVDVLDRLEALGGRHAWRRSGDEAFVLEVRVPCGS